MIGGIVLAAGSSRRFGDDKRKLKLPSGKTVLQQSVENAAAALDDVLVVLRFGDQPYVSELEREIRNHNVRFFRAPDSAQGMAHSLANAIHEVEDWEAIVVLLGDMPYLRPDTIAAVVDAYKSDEASDPIVVPTANDRPGHPVLFPACYYEEIEALQGDTGAKRVIDAHSGKVIHVDVGDDAIFQDIDTPEDLEAS